MGREFRNQFSWSFSRHRLFSECRRQYWLNYYGYWGGWKNDAPEEQRLIYRLKNMQSMPMWLGTIVHDMAERILGDARNCEVNTLDAYQKQARDRMNRDWLRSVEKQWQWKPKYATNLFEHYYGVEVTADERVAARDKVFKCLANFMQSDLFARLQRLRPNEWKSIEKLEQFVVGEQPVFVKIDCSALVDGRMTIYDWKTGKVTDDTEKQLGCYALYAFQVWHAPLEEQNLVSYYLDPNVVQEHTPNAEGLVETKNFILESMESMVEALDSTADANVASKNNFPMTDKRYLCQRCFFREVCYGTRELEDAF